jgi:hypothetical protein
MKIKEWMNQETGFCAGWRSRVRTLGAGEAAPADSEAVSEETPEHDWTIENRPGYHGRHKSEE